MSHNSHHRSHRRHPVLGLLVGIFVLAALAAQPLHLMEELGDGVPSVSMQAEAHPTSGAGSDASPFAPGETPSSSDDGACLDCMAFSHSVVTGAWVAVPVALSLVATASPPSPRPPMEFRGKADARPRAPPSA
jgi:hypothetical protein